MDVKVNSERSYLGKDIKAWCMDEIEDAHALEIKRKYYSDDVEFKPSDRVYYFVEYVVQNWNTILYINFQKYTKF